MIRIVKTIGFVIVVLLAVRCAYASFGVGNIDASMAIERVAVSSDGRLYAWDKQGAVAPGWPKDLRSEGRVFTYGPRMIDIDLDQVQEIVAVSEAKSGGNLRMHVFKGSGIELSSWSFSIPDSDLAETPIIADVNHDSSLEIIYSTISGKVHAFRRDFHALPNFTKSFNGIPRIVSGDPDNDGLANLFVATGDTIQTWDESGNASVLYRLPAGEEAVGGITIIDINRDDYPELVFATSGGRIIAIDQHGNQKLALKVPSGANISSSVVVDDIDIDKMPEFIVTTDKQDVLVFKSNGEPLSEWNYLLDYREPPPISGVVANDLYRGLFSTVTGIDQNYLYRTRHNTYSRIKLGENVREWDDFANFDYLEMIEVFDLFTWPLPFTPNGDGVNDVAYIHYRLSQNALVAVDLYDSHERFISRVQEKVFEGAGEHQTQWEGVDTKGTATKNDDVLLGTGAYIVKIVAESPDGFVTQAKALAVVNGIKAEIEIPKDDDENDTVYPVVFRKVAISGIAIDPNFGEDNLDADFKAYKLYYREGIWSVSNEEVLTVGQLASPWKPVVVPLQSQCPKNDFKEPADAAYPNSNVSCRPVQHGVLGTFDSSALPNGEYTLLLKVTDSNGNTLGKVSYDTLVVQVANPNPSDPFDPSNPFDPNNPANPKYKGPAITGAALSNVNITRQNPSTSISYVLENETSNVHVTIFSIDGGSYGTPVRTFSFNYEPPNDAGNPKYAITWDGTNSLGRNVNGGGYGVRIEANAVDGTGVAVNDSLRLNVAKGFAASDTLGVDKDPVTGETQFTATPTHFNPLAFGPDMQPQKTYLSYKLTKEAKIKLEVLEYVEGQGFVLQKTISSGKIAKQSDGSDYWDGTGDNGLVLAIGKNYIIRLTAEGIDIGNEELIYKDVVVHLDSTVLDGSIVSNISQLKGFDGVTVGENDGLKAMTGSPDFLWRADATGYVSMPFSYTISASGRETYYVPDYPVSASQALYNCNITCAVACDPVCAASNPWDEITQCIREFKSGYHATNITQTLSVSVPSNYTVSRFDIRVDGASGEFTADNFSGVHESFTLPSGLSQNYGPPWPAPLNNPQTVSFTGKSLGGGSDTGIACEPYDGRVFDCGQATISCVTGNVHQSGTMTVSAVGGGASGERDWGPYSNSGSSSLTSIGTNPDYNFDSYQGQVGSGQADVQSAWVTDYDLAVSNVVNGYGSSNSSNSGTITLPGLQAWLDGSGGLSAQVYHNGGMLTTYSTMQHDSYLQGIAYKKAWGWYRNFNRQFYRRSTSNISYYYNGYRPNVFGGNPGTNLYSFSDAVRLTGWNVDVRYPNVTVSKPDGDNALNTGAGHLDVFDIEAAYVSPAGTRGTQNSNIEDYFRLRLLPLASPKTFVEIWGSAGANYELYYYDAKSDNPAWHSIEPRTHNPVSNSLLAHWDVTGLNGENYTVVLKATSGSSVNEDLFNIGIGDRVDTSGLAEDQFVRVYTPFKRASLIFSKDSVPDGPALVTINPVKPDSADYKLPTGIVPLGPIFDIKPDGLNINPDHHVQLEITYTPAELTEAFGVADATELTIYNLAGDEALEGLATVVLFDDMDDDDPTNDVWRFTASLEHFSQYFLAKKISGYFHVDSPVKSSSLHGLTRITGRVENSPRPSSAPDVAKPLANLTSIAISYHPAGDSASRVQIYSNTSQNPTTAFSQFDFEWDASGLNGSYVLQFDAEGPQGGHARYEMPVAIDNTPALSTLIINGVAVADGGEVTAASGAVLEIKASDSASNDWQSGVASIEYSIDEGAFVQYVQPMNLWLQTGAHTIVYHATDDIGNVEPDKTATVVIQEKMSPEESGNVDLRLTISGPVFNKDNHTWVGDGTVLTIESVGAAEVEHIKYRFDGSEYQIYSGPVRVHNLSEGQYVFEFFATDALGLRSEVHSKPLLLDVTPPASSYSIEGLYTMGDNGAITVSPTTKISLAAKEIGESPAGLGRIEYKLDDGAWKLYGGPLTFSANTLFSYRAIDNLGNEETPHVLNIRIDDTAPQLGIVSMSNVISPNGDGRNDAATLVVNASDNLYTAMYLTMSIASAEQNYVIFDGVELKKGENKLTWDGKIDGQMIPEATYSYSLKITDAGGNESDSSSGTLTYDITPPKVNVTNGTVHSFSPNGDDISDILQVDYTVADNLFSSGIAVELRMLTPADYEISKSSEVVDSPPLEHSLSWNGTNAMANGAFDGNYKFEIVAEDPAGNRSVPQGGQGNQAGGEVFVDRLAPDTRMHVDGPYLDDGNTLWLGKGALVSLSATDPVPASGLAAILYGVGSEELHAYVKAFTVPAEGIDYQLHYRATDMVGNVEPQHDKQVRLDTTPPKTDISVGEPKEADDTGEVFVSPKTPITLSAVDEDGVGVENIYTEIDGSKDPAPYGGELILDGLGDGKYKISYWAVDQLTNAEDKRHIYLLLDKTPPVTKIVIGDPKYVADEEDAAYVTSRTPISFTTKTDRNDLQRTEYKLDDGDWRPAEEFTLGGEGKYVVSFRSFDRLKNEEPEKHRTIIVDNSPPSADLELNQGSGLGNNLVTPTTVISLHASDSGSKVGTIEYSIDGGQFIPYSDPFSLGKLPSGTHEIRYRVRDRLGNISEERTFTANLVDVLVERAMNQIPRVLVFMLQTHDLRERDPKPNENLIRNLSSEFGGYMKVITGNHNIPATVDSFLAELRSDKYNTFIFATDALVVEFYDSEKIVNMFREIKSRIYKGDSFISMVGYAQVDGRPWSDFLTGFVNEEGGITGDFGGVDVGLITQRHGWGSIASFGGDLGRLASGVAYNAVCDGLLSVISQMVPTHDEYNAGEVVDWTMSFENMGDDNVKLSVNERFPKGWIETASTDGEVGVDSREYEIEVAPHSKKFVDYLYRADVEGGSYEMTSDINSVWSSGGIASRDELTSPFSVEYDLFGLLDRLIGPGGLIAGDSMPDVEQGLSMISRRLSLSMSALTNDDELNELIVFALDSIDALGKYQTDKRDEIYLAICELVENLGAARSLETLGLQFSVNVGDPNDPASYHGDTSSSLGAGGGGCNIGIDSNTSGSSALWLLLLTLVPRQG